MIPRIESAGYKLGIRYLTEAEDGLTVHDLARKLGVARRNAQKYVQAWLSNNAIYIARWDRDHRNYPVPVYRAQPPGCRLPHRPKPTALSHAQKARKARAKRKIESMALERFSKYGHSIVLLCLMPPSSKGRGV